MGDAWGHSPKTENHAIPKGPGQPVGADAVCNLWPPT